MPSKSQLKRAKRKAYYEQSKKDVSNTDPVPAVLPEKEIVEEPQQPGPQNDPPLSSTMDPVPIVPPEREIAEEQPQARSQTEIYNEPVWAAIVDVFRDPHGFLISDHISFFANLMRSVSQYDMVRTDMMHYLDQIVAAEQGRKHLQILYVSSGLPCGTGHWITAFYDGIIIRIYDSMNAQTLQPGPKKFLQKLFPFNPTIQLCKVQAQQTSYDCGLFAIAFCVSVLFDRDPEQETYDLSQLRSHAAEIFSTRQIVLFPTIVPPEPTLSQLAITREARRKEQLRRNYLKRKSEESASARDLRLKKMRENKQDMIAGLSPAERNDRLQQFREQQQTRIANETVEERNLRISNMIASNNTRQIQNQDQVQTSYKAAYRGLEETVDLQYLGKMDTICEDCHAKHFQYERPSDGKFTLCCRKGTHEPDVLEEYPSYLLQLVTGIIRESNNFRQHVRSYNSAMAFASMGAQLSPPPGQGPFTFRIHGQIYHNTKSLYPRPGRQENYAQLYIVDTVSALQKRMNVPANKSCLPEIMQELDKLLRAINPFCEAYMMLKEVENREIQKAQLNNTTVPEIEMWFMNERNKDKRRYNIPTCNEVAVIFAGHDGAPPPNRDICVHPRGQTSIPIYPMSGNCDPMTYPLLFPHGDMGWTRLRTAKDGRKQVSPLQFYVNRLQARQNVFNPCLELGKLTQQYIVDAYCKVESERLTYVRQNQGKLRVELYAGLYDHINNLATREQVKPGKMVILPSSFQGGARFMQIMYQNSMAIVREFGKPDLFITFTCNPKWREIKEELRGHQNASDRPDLVARVFNGKVKALLHELIKDQIFGQVIAHMYVIEFQKRGLPHMHLLLMLSAQDKIRNRDDINSIISAEIPDAENELELYQIVRSSMIHGPCGPLNPNAPCMENEICTKKYPKDFCEETCENINGYPIYRRRNTGLTMDILNSMLFYEA